MTTIARILVFSAAVTAVAPVAAQQPVEKGQPAAAPAPAKPAADKAQAPAPPPPVEPAYTYDAKGRRDPFASLLSRGTDAPAGPRTGGVMGLSIGEVTVKGIVRDRTGFIAMIQGTDTKTFIVRSGEKLMDGTVKAITADTVVFSQEVTDPLSLVKQKEVRKTVRPLDGGRG